MHTPPSLWTDRPDRRLEAPEPQAAAVAAGSRHTTGSAPAHRRAPRIPVVLAAVCLLGTGGAGGVLLARDDGAQTPAFATARLPAASGGVAATPVGEIYATGLALGADDYLPKPFRFDELVARVHALARRAGVARPPVLRHGDVELDPARRTATRAGRPLRLAPKEFGVLGPCWPPTVPPCRPRSCSSGCGTTTSTRSPPRCG